MKLPLLALLPLLLAACGGAGGAETYPGGAGGGGGTDGGGGTGGATGGGVLLQAVAVAVGTSHSCALLADATVACWGSGARGQLGDGISGKDHFQPSPVPVPGLDAVLALDAGGDTTCAVTAGAVLCWGAGDFGQLGDGTAADGHVSAVPGPVQGLGAATGVAVAGANACATLADGGVACWGRNAAEAWLGFESADCGPYAVVDAEGHTSLQPFPCEPAPRLVPGAAKATSVGAGGQHACLLRDDGKARCWGADHFGQLGDGDSGPDAHHAQPVDVKDLAGAGRLALGTSHTCALGEPEGTLRCWGNNDFGQLGIGTDALDSYKVTPALIPDLVAVVDLHAAGNTTCAASSVGVSCWGDTATVLPVSPAGKGSAVVPTVVPGTASARAVRTGGSHACALFDDATVRCWGSNDRGQLGNGTQGLSDYTILPVFAAE